MILRPSLKSLHLHVFLRDQEPRVFLSLSFAAVAYALPAVDWANPVVSTRMPAPIVLETLTFFM